jgi:hypothetical protein
MFALIPLAMLGVVASPNINPSASVPSHLVRNRLQFERIGYHGTMWFNSDQSYVLVQIDPSEKATVFAGQWTGNGSSGFCMMPAEAPRRSKCFTETPTVAGGHGKIISSLGEVYDVTLQAGR